ncbi:hypothetical protein DAKH74_051540 [Maudiozyma humilis]|uniref:Endonuclease/exonuclease/phosphatase domain-containing protein n=1 Tax=Maudiozyma humilis TaxID=51915 RepID=A0AAV5S7J7_MAUHU|nr:hypothetical protein DAKH74_051540 [Kazachstania humilis]
MREMITGEAPKHLKLSKEELTPELLAEVRRLRAKERARREQAEREDPRFAFVERPMLAIPAGSGGTSVDGFGSGSGSLRFTIMTYNILAQSLIRRELFPGSAEAIRWSHRSRTLLRELAHYDADVVCLQEVDVKQLDKWWVPRMHDRGYEGRFYRGPRTKVHGVAIFWKVKLFECVDMVQCNLDDPIATQGVDPELREPRTRTRNAAIILALQFKGIIAGSQRKGIIVGTTHLFWHQFGTFERVRQLYVILEQFYLLLKRLNGGDSATDGTDQWLPLLTGDFNSQPGGPPYAAITTKPVHFTPRQQATMECSLSYTYSKRRNTEGEDHAETSNSNSDSDSDDDDEQERLIMEQNPKDPHPLAYQGTPQQVQQTRAAQQLHNTVPLTGTSLYGAAYRYAHPENALLSGGHQGEPEMSHGSLHWTGLLDYVFVLGPPGTPLGNSSNTATTALQTLEQERGVRVHALLRMPLKAEMPPHIQPHEGEYPSDHLCMMCDLEVRLR